MLVPIREGSALARHDALAQVMQTDFVAVQILLGIDSESYCSHHVFAGQDQVSQRAATLAQSDQAHPDKGQEDGRRQVAVGLWALYE